MDEGRKRVIGLMAAILSAMHMQRADDLFGMPNGTPNTDGLIGGEYSVGGADHAENRQSALRMRIEELPWKLLSSHRLRFFWAEYSGGTPHPSIFQNPRELGGSVYGSKPTGAFAIRSSASSAER
jgi:hypothetical protein